ncbi:hypothetical protein BKA67DRAFT_177584 [Truncatella angustata]|uniref:C2H2-type domain-containing protein n=1 Tax=Truncatella angustata TaxID=152316 RepID=A0A9P8URY7_9PEZI|nr:uncharacterized protein BKA67DRAFT_177584 [Truncatella angustata]KAH6657022.1 hypothetical protein BKA67DRAFT_177584 [Truncatella angustata]
MPLHRSIDAKLCKYVEQEDERKWKCKAPECAKLFSEEHFGRRHVERRHAEWLKELERKKK